MNNEENSLENFIKNVEDNPNFDMKDSEILIDGKTPEEIRKELEEEESNNDDDEVFYDEGGVVDPTKYNKYIAHYDIQLFAKEPGELINLENARCIFTARNMEMARYISCHQVTEMCMMMQVAVYSYRLINIECVETGEIYEIKK